MKVSQLPNPKTDPKLLIPFYPKSDNPRDKDWGLFPDQFDQELICHRPKNLPPPNLAGSEDFLILFG